MAQPPFTRVRLSRRALQRHVQGFLHSLQNRSPETRGTYDRALREFLRWFLRDRNVAFLVADIERYKRYLTVRRRLSSVSVSTYLTALRRFCEYLVRVRVLRANPARLVEGNKRPTAHSRAYLTSSDIEGLLGAIDRSDPLGRRDYAIVLLMAGCALSEIELVRADVGDLHAFDGGHALWVQGKGRRAKDQRVVLPPPAWECLADYLEHRGSTNPGDPLFASAGNRTRGERMTTRGIRNRVNGHLERAGIKQGKLRRITPYSLRHTAALLMAREGATAEEIRDRMRLGSETTARLYIDHTTTPPTTTEE
jgi:integrase/recombinase XerC/integrase/recombinase XerD